VFGESGHEKTPGGFPPEGWSGGQGRLVLPHEVKEAASLSFVGSLHRADFGKGVMLGVAQGLGNVLERGNEAFGFQLGHDLTNGEATAFGVGLGDFAVKRFNGLHDRRAEHHTGVRGQDDGIGLNGLASLRKHQLDEVGHGDWIANPLCRGRTNGVILLLEFASGTHRATHFLAIDFHAVCLVVFVSVGCVSATDKMTMQ
jgi:hypothetical protein